MREGDKKTIGVPKAIRNGNEGAEVLVSNRGVQGEEGGTTGRTGSDDPGVGHRTFASPSSLSVHAT